MRAYTAVTLLRLLLQELLQSPPLLLQVFDRDGLISSHEIGRVSLSLEKLRFEDIVPYEQPLNTQGGIYFSVEWVPAPPSLLSSLLGSSASIGLEKTSLTAAASELTAEQLDTRLSESGTLRLKIVRGVGLLERQATVTYRHIPSHTVT